MNIAGAVGRAVIGRRRAATGPTYAAFLAHINAKESPTVIASWDSGTFLSAGAYVVTAGASATGNMFGSPNQQAVFYGVPPSRLIQHAVSSQAQHNAIMANARRCWFRATSAGNVDPFVSVDRNGYTSLGESDGSPDPAVYIDQVIWWDESLGARQRNPVGNRAETAYTW